METLGRIIKRFLGLTDNIFFDRLTKSIYYAETNISTEKKKKSANSWFSSPYAHARRPAGLGASPPKRPFSPGDLRYIMLKTKYRLKRKADFARIYRRGRYFFTPSLVLRFLSNDKDFSRFALVISAKITPKATLRNQLKRQLSEIIRLNFTHIGVGFDLLLAAKKPLLTQDFTAKKASLISLFKQAKLWQN